MVLPHIKSRWPNEPVLYAGSGACRILRSNLVDVTVVSDLTEALAPLAGGIKAGRAAPVTN
jgi:hypothetical protein